jgi:hypothetical protein
MSQNFVLNNYDRTGRLICVFRFFYRAKKVSRSYRRNQAILAENEASLRGIRRTQRALGQIFDLVVNAPIDPAFRVVAGAEMSEMEEDALERARAAWMEGWKLLREIMEEIGEPIPEIICIAL